MGNTRRNWTMLALSVLLIVMSPLIGLAVAAVTTTNQTISFPTAVEPADAEAAVGLAAELVKTIVEGDYAKAVPFALVLIVFVIRKYLWKRIPSKWIPVALPLLAAAMAVAGGLKMGLDPVKAAINGLMAGFTAVGVNQGWKAVKDTWRPAPPGEGKP